MTPANQVDPNEVIIQLYVLVSGLLYYPVIRKPMRRWYRSQLWLTSGQNPVDVFVKRIGFWLSFEGFIFVLSCALGSIGGNLYALIKLFLFIFGSKKDVSKETDND